MGGEMIRTCDLAFRRACPVASLLAGDKALQQDRQFVEYMRSASVIVSQSRSARYCE